MDSYTIISCIIILICSYFIIFSVGFVIGYILNSNIKKLPENPVGFFKKQKDNKDIVNNSINIDDTKVVLKIDTNGMEKKFDKITESKSIQNNIGDSINKLKNMKGK